MYVTNIWGMNHPDASFDQLMLLARSNNALRLVHAKRSVLRHPKLIP